jgi:hypothetical protein
MLNYPVGLLHAGFMPSWARGFAPAVAGLRDAIDNKGEFGEPIGAPAMELAQSGTESMR